MDVNLKRPVNANEQNNEGKAGGDAGRKKRLEWAIIASLFLVAVAIVIFVFSSGNNQKYINQSVISVNYTITVDDPNIKILRVTTDIFINKLSSESMVYFYREGFRSPIISCMDEKGKELEVFDSGEIMSIGPLDRTSKHVTMVYDVRVGYEYAEQTSARRHQGDLYSDLLVFSGDKVLMFPLMDVSDMTSPEKYVNSVSFKLDADFGWQAIMPFGEELSSDLSFTIKKPTWSDFNAISKSAFCFGRFDRFDAGVGGPVFIDSGAGGGISRQSVEALKSFLQYYDALFGELPPDAPLVLLRNAMEDNIMILGGVGSKGGAISIDLNQAEDCQTLSTTLFHLYFDSKVKARNLRMLPYSWIYNGLSNYHVNRSSRGLSEDIKDAFSIANVGEPEIDYLKYLYFSLKEPNFLAVNPSMEGSMSDLEYGYYMNIKVPTMIAFIDYCIAENGKDSFIGALVEAGAEERELDVNAFLERECGSGYDGLIRYFSGSALLPNYNNYNIDGTMQDEEIISVLDEAESYFAYLIEGHHELFYMYLPLELLNYEEFFREAESIGARYSTDEVQAEVEGFSKTLHQFLMQFATFAKMAGIDDITQTRNDQSLYGAGSYDMWMEFCDRVGYKNLN